MLTILAITAFFLISLVLVGPARSTGGPEYGTKTLRGKSQTSSKAGQPEKRGETIHASDRGTDTRGTAYFSTGRGNYNPAENGELGMQVAVYLDGEQVVDVWGGIADETTGRAVDGDTLFPPPSPSSRATTATALHLQAERGLIEYDAPIAHYWPEFAGPTARTTATVRDALSHRLGIPYMPEGVTPELMSNYDWMVEQLANMKPLFAAGTQNAYMCYTFGWVVAEGVCAGPTPNSGPTALSYRKRYARPLGMTDLWIGIPEEAESRDSAAEERALRCHCRQTLRSCGPCRLKSERAEEVFGRSDMRRGCIPGAHGIMNARSSARLFAMLANGGELNGVRLLSEDRVKTFSTPRPDTDQPDTVLGHGDPHGHRRAVGRWTGERPQIPVSTLPV